jgi:outer membrane immunogenic protein
MRHILWLLSSLVLVLSVAPAIAQTFVGPHIEGVIGSNHDLRSKTPDLSEGISLLYGAGAGYDFRIGGIVAGALAELGDATGNSCFDATIAPSVGFPGQSGRACSHDGCSFFVGGRLGAVVPEHTLIYGLASVADVPPRRVVQGNL